MLLAAARWALRRRAARKYAACAPHLPPACRLLDIGAAEGYVGACAAADGHAVSLVDVEDRNRSALPFQRYDGRTLPFPDGAFDAGILSYVLHHCADPGRVLAEAARVCRRLLVLESTYEQPWEKALLTFLDHSANRLRGMPEEQLRFASPATWWRRFVEQGLTLREFRWLGRTVHKHVLFVLDCNPPGGVLS